MGSLGCGCAVLAAIFAIVGTVPLLGWTNWLTTIPASLMAIVFGVIGVTTNQQRTLGSLALAAGILLFFWAVFRLTLGGGLL